MRLHVSRSQAHQGTDRKGRSEGVVFTFRCQLHLSDEEQQVIEKYRLWESPIVHLPLTEIRHLDQDDSLWNPRRLMEGWTFHTRYAGDALHAESLMQTGCSEFNDVLEMVVGYGGEAEYEF